MQLRFLAGVIHSTRCSGAAISNGRGVSVDANDKWVHSGDGIRPLGIAMQDHRVISSGFNIYNSSYDEGLASTYDGRRNPYKTSYDNVGAPLAVLMGAGNVLEIPYTAYVGNLTGNMLLTSNASGCWKATADTNGDAAAQVMVPGNRANRATVGIMTL